MDYKLFLPEQPYIESEYFTICCSQSLNDYSKEVIDYIEKQRTCNNSD